MKQETVEEAAENYANDCTLVSETASYEAFIEGAKWQQERMYSEEDLEKSFKAGREGDMVFNNESPKYWDFNQWFQQFKK